MITGLEFIKHIVVLMLENRSFDNILGETFEPGVTRINKFYPPHEHLMRDFDLNLDAHLTPNKGQIKGASGKASSKILARFGESRPFPVEGGRTNRGNIKTAESLLSPLAESGIGRLSKEERNLRPDQNH